MRIFNRDIYKRNRTRFSALAGAVSPVTCVSFEEGDGFAPASSATYNIDDAMHIRLAHQALTSEHVFKTFVKERLTLSPKVAKAEEAMYNGQNFPAHKNPAANAFANIPATWQASAAPGIFSNPVAAQQADETIPGVTLDTAVKIPAGQSVEIDVPVLTGARAAVVLAAESNISATLTDASGKIIGKSASADAEQVFRAMVIEKPIAGNLKLRLENAGKEESIALVAARTDTDPLQLALSVGEPNSAGQVLLQAKLTMNGSPVTGALVKANVFIGQKTEIVFFDDGKHADGAAGDGIYGAATGKLAAGDYFIEVRAETAGQIRTASAAVQIGKTSK
jgi:hypothetical protein